MTELTPKELDRLIKHLRGQRQGESEIIGGYPREFKSNYCIAADYLEALEDCNERGYSHRDAVTERLSLIASILLCILTELNKCNLTSDGESKRISGMYGF